jgi:hypothetical protein
MSAEPPLHRDRWITCAPERLVIRGYYFPLGTSKSIAYRDIRRVDEVAMTALSGRWRIWGTSNPRYWFHLDWGRPHKTSALVLDVGRFVKPVSTPDDSARVAEIMEQRRSGAG